MQYLVRRGFSVMNKVFVPGEVFDEQILRHKDHYIREKKIVALPMSPKVEAEVALYLRNRYGVELHLADVAIPQEPEETEVPEIVEVEEVKVKTTSAAELAAKAAAAAISATKKTATKKATTK